MVHSNFKKYRLDLLFISLLTLTFPLFFYKLGQTSLFSFDEAWYVEVSKQIANTGSLFILYFNGNYYYDHPTTGYWIMALAIKLFGYSNLVVRLPSAIAGIFCLYFTYLLGKHLFNRWVGFLSAASLVSTIWFISRARSGNLDVILTLFFLLSIYFGIKAAKNTRFFIPFFSSFALLLLVKTLVPFTVLPVLVVIFWGSKNVLNKYFGLGVLATLGIFGYWFYSQLSTNSHFTNYYLGIGLPGVSGQTDYLDNFQKIKTYLHNGIGKWFWPGVFSLIGGLVLRKKNFLILFVFCFCFFIPFIFSARGQIWHLIPLYPFMLLAFYGFLYLLGIWAIEIFKLKGYKEFMVGLGMLTVFLYFFIPQVKAVWYQVIDIPAFISDEEILSKEASKYPQKLYITGDFLPAAVFYSDKNVERAHEYVLEKMFSENQEFLMIIDKKQLEKIPAKNYKILKQDRDNRLVKKI